MVKYSGHVLVVAHPTSRGKQLSRGAGAALASLLLRWGRARSPEEVVMLQLRTIAMFAVLALAGCTQNDTQITQRVQDRLAKEGLTNQINVDTTRRVVKLEGVVSDRAELNRAEMAARNTPGIMGVDNRLVVQNPVNVTGGSMETQGKPQASPAGPRGPSTSNVPSAP